VPRGRCSSSVSVGGHGGVVLVLLWGVESRAFIVLRIAVDMARLDELLACHVSALWLWLLWLWALSAAEASVCVGGWCVIGHGRCCCG
jgi:hypothetical protein